MVTLMVTGWVPNALAALIACLLMGATRCITLNSAYKSIQWPSLILIIGMMPFSTALQKTGGVELAAQGLLHISARPSRACPSQRCLRSPRSSASSSRTPRPSCSWRRSH